MSTAEKTQQQRIDELVTRIERHQASLKLNDTSFVGRYGRYIGSQKTWRNRLCGRDWKELMPRGDKWEQKLRTLVTIIDGGSAVEEFFETLPIARYGLRLFELLQGQQSDRRNGVLLGLYGVGKTVTLRKLNALYPTTSAYVRATPSWNNNLMQISLGMARALGTSEEASGAGTFNHVIDFLKGNPITLMIDEAHEGGVLLFKLVKTLIDESKAKIMMASYPTAWTRLCNGSNDAYAEAQQLLGRTMKPIEMRWTKGLDAEDVARYLEAATGLNGECRGLAARILPIIRRAGNFRLLADALDMSRMAADSEGGEITGGLIESALNELVPAAPKETR